MTKNDPSPFIFGVVLFYIFRDCSIYIYILYLPSTHYVVVALVPTIPGLWGSFLYILFFPLTFCMHGKPISFINHFIQCCHPILLSFAY